MRLSSRENGAVDKGGIKGETLQKAPQVAAWFATDALDPLRVENVLDDFRTRVAQSPDQGAKQGRRPALKAARHADADHTAEQQPEVAARDVNEQSLPDVRMPSKMDPPHPAGLAHVGKRPLEQLPSTPQQATAPRPANPAPVGMHPLAGRRLARPAAAAPVRFRQVAAQSQRRQIRQRLVGVAPFVAHPCRPPPLRCQVPPAKPPRAARPPSSASRPSMMGSTPPLGGIAMCQGGTSMTHHLEEEASHGTLAPIIGRDVVANGSSAGDQNVMTVGRPRPGGSLTSRTRAPGCGGEGGRGEPPFRSGGRRARLSCARRRFFSFWRRVDARPGRVALLVFATTVARHTNDTSRSGASSRSCSPVRNRYDFEGEIVHGTKRRRRLPRQRRPADRAAGRGGRTLPDGGWERGALRRRPHPADRDPRVPGERLGVFAAGTHASDRAPAGPGRAG